jgi:hypothetical protein
LFAQATSKLAAVEDGATVLGDGSQGKGCCLSAISRGPLD